MAEPQKVAEHKIARVQGSPAGSNLLFRRFNPLSEAARANRERSERISDAINTLRTGKSWEERANAAETLGDFKDMRSVTALLDAIKDEHKYVRQSVISSLGQVGDRSIVNRLLAAATDRNEDECNRRLAFIYMAKLGTRDQVSKLKAFQKSHPANQFTTEIEIAISEMRRRE